jgi:8-hydroxy-5-deazaflavin:NADPH oxidoreductase
VSTLSIAVIGARDIGRTLATRFAQAGHQVTFGARNPEDAELRKTAQEIGAEVAGIGAAVDASEVVVWAIPGEAMADAVKAAAAHLDGKIVIDATNNFTGGAFNSIDVIARHAPSAHAYRAFNSLGWENFADPDYGAIVGDLVYSGPDGEPRQAAEAVIAATGLRPIRVGDNDKAAVVDGLTALWLALAFDQGMGRGLGFKLLTR